MCCWQWYWGDVTAVTAAHVRAAGRQLGLGRAVQLSLT